MTIITKPLSEKKGDKLIVPLVENDQLAASAPPADVESQSNIIILPSRAHRVSGVKTLFLLITALLIVGIGVISGIFLYEQYLQRPRYSGRFDVQFPYSEEYSSEDDNVNFDDTDDDNAFLSQLIQKQPKMPMFQEKFEIDEANQYENIIVPDFRDDRNGRFIHDFNTNITCIMDTTSNRCFVMPLNRENILPPKSLYDLIHKMWDGYYKIDTSVVRQNMRVVTPPLTDLSNIGPYIKNECNGLPVYKLEKYVSGVVKRSAELQPEAKFAHFAGKGILEFDIVNIEDATTYENSIKS